MNNTHSATAATRRCLDNDRVANLARNAQIVVRIVAVATPDIEAAFHVLWAMLHGLISLQTTVAHDEIPDGLEDLTLRVVEAGLFQGNEEG